jgi:hypothetical protein
MEKVVHDDQVNWHAKFEYFWRIERHLNLISKFKLV